MDKTSSRRDRHDNAPMHKCDQLHQSTLDAPRRALGTHTETETIERALDLVAFGERLAKGTKRAHRRPWNDIFGEMEDFESEAEA